MPLHRLFRLKPALAGFMLVCIVFTAHAAGEYIPAGQPVPQNIRWVGDTVAGADTHASAFWRNAGQTTHHKFPVPVSSSTLGKLAKGALTRGIPLAGSYLVLKDLVNGAGWVIDELGKQVTTPGVPAEAPNTGTYMYCMSGSNAVDFGMSNHTRCASTPDAVCAYFIGKPYIPMPGVTATFCDKRSAADNRVGLSNTGDIAFSRVFSTTWNPATQQNINPSTPAAPVSDTQLGEMIKANAEVVNAVLIDPVTGAPIRTQELTDALNNLRRALETANGLTPGTDLTADTAPGQTETPNQSEWPAFCNWATVVCDFIDWVKKPEQETEPPEVPFEQQEMPSESWTSGLGGGTCPAPESVTVSLSGASQTVEFEYEPICQFASSMRPVIIAMALLLVPMIVGGFRSSKDA